MFTKVTEVILLKSIFKNQMIAAFELLIRNS